ncbi:MAG: DUF4234 domain-containing protein [Bdellovibrionota bacterium]
MQPQIKRRNMFVQALLMVVTVGLYSVYWFYQTASEMKAVANDTNAQVGLWTVFMFFPPLNLYSVYKFGELFEKTGDEKLNRWIVFLLWLVFAPVVWILVQIDLNKKATALLTGQGSGFQSAV